jgi:hypothetical protein
MLSRAFLRVFVTFLSPLVFLASVDWGFHEGEGMTLSTSNQILTVKVKRVDKESIDLTHPDTGAVTTVRLSAIQTVTHGSTAQRLAGVPAVSAARPLAMKHVVYVHGICRHKKHYSDEWWAAMKQFLPAIPEQNHHEVLWSDLVHPAAMVAMRVGPAAEAQNSVASAPAAKLVLRRKSRRDSGVRHSAVEG